MDIDDYRIYGGGTVGHKMAQITDLLKFMTNFNCYRMCFLRLSQRSAELSFHTIISIFIRIVIFHRNRKCNHIETLPIKLKL